MHPSMTQSASWQGSDEHHAGISLSAHGLQSDQPSTPEERTRHALRLAEQALAEAQQMSEHVQQLPSARIVSTVINLHGWGHECRRVCRVGTQLWGAVTPESLHVGSGVCRGPTGSLWLSSRRHSRLHLRACGCRMLRASWLRRPQHCWSALPLGGAACARARSTPQVVDTADNVHGRLPASWFASCGLDLRNAGCILTAVGNTL
jgi:hypothetical protein